MENIENSRSNPAGDNSVIQKKIKTAEKEGVRKAVLISVLVSLVILIIAGAVALTHFKNERNKQLALYNTKVRSFTEMVNTRDSVINDWLTTFDQIEKDLSLIKEKENIITIKTSDSEFSKTKKDQILNDIRYLNTLLENNKKKIALLNSQLKSSGGTIKGLQTRITTLESRLKEYETNIAELKENLVKKDFEIGELNTKLADLEVTITQKDEKIATQVSQMNEAFLTSGTFRELKNKGIVSKEGGFLGIGRTGTIVKDVNENLFAKVDIRETTTIPINSRDAKLITKHPSNSYAMIHEGDNKISRIEIKNPENFWKISRYAVVELIK